MQQQYYFFLREEFRKQIAQLQLHEICLKLLVHCAEKIIKNMIFRYVAYGNEILQQSLHFKVFVAFLRLQIADFLELFVVFFDQTRKTNRVVADYNKSFCFQGFFLLIFKEI